MKKAVSLFLVIIAVMSLFCGAASAERKLTAEVYTGGFVPSNERISEAAELQKPPIMRVRFSGPSKTIYEYVEEQLLARAETITVYPQYKVDVDTFFKVLRTVLFNNYKIMAYDEIDGYCIIGDYFYSFNPTYFTPEEGDEVALEMMETEINNYLDAVEEIPDNDVIGKVLVIHDLFCKNNRYSLEEYEEETNTQIANNAQRTAYYLFKNKRAVCQGNAIALKAIYDALNEKLKGNGTDNVIETSFCSSDRKAHIWNVVKIGGKWYHLDETFDDPVYKDTSGQVVEIPYAQHNSFLKSSDEMGDHIEGVCDWVYYTDEDIVCDDKKYENGYIFSTSYGRDIITSYENNRYRLDISGIPKPFWANGIKMTKILTTDTFEYNEKKGIYYYAEDAVTANLCCAAYAEDGEITDLWIGKNIGITSGFSMKLLSSFENGRIFHWAEDGITPLCRVIETE